MRLHTVFRCQLSPGALEDEGLCEAVNKNVETHLRDLDGPARVVTMLRTYISEKCKDV